MDEARSQEHAHKHAHRESFAIPGGEVFLEAHAHDQAVTVSAAICPAEGHEVAFPALTAALQDVARGVEDAGGIVGHVKAFARDDGAFAHASVTQAGTDADCGGNAGCSFGAEADIQMVAIALLIGLDELLTIYNRVLGYGEDELRLTGK